jgi:serine/threonine protein kinase
VNVVRLVHEQVLEGPFDLPCQSRDLRDASRRVIQVVPAFCLVIEWCEFGDLMNMLLRGPAMDERTALSYYAQLVAGLKATADAGVYHFDLKPENVFFTYKTKAIDLVDDNEPNHVLKIGDFGLALLDHVDGAGVPISAERGGTRQYMTPELLCRRYIYAGRPIDVFCSGIVLFMMIQQGVPWAAASVGDGCWERFRRPNMCGEFWAYHEGRRGAGATPHSNSVKQLVHAILHEEPSRRPTIEALLAHELLANPLSPEHLVAAMRDGLHRMNVQAEVQRERDASATREATAIRAAAAFLKPDREPVRFVNVKAALANSRRAAASASGAGDGTRAACAGGNDVDSEMELELALETTLIHA